MIAGIYKRKFESAGFAVDVETDGSNGYYRIFKDPPDAVLLDLLLPGMDGPNIIRKFRAQRKFSELPIIVFTNAYLTRVGRDAVNAGASKVFNKATVTPKEIVDAVVNALNQNPDYQYQNAEYRSPEPQSAALPDPVKKADETPIFGMVKEDSFHSEPQQPSSTPPPMPVVANVAQETPKPTEPTAAVEKPEENPVPKQDLESSPPVAETPEKKLYNEGALQALVRGEFLQKSDGRIQAMRQILRALQGAGTRAPKGEAFIEIARIAHQMSASAAIIGLHYLAHIAAALEALAWELFDDPSQFGTPTRQTFAKAIDMLARLADCGATSQLKEFSQFNVLVVDDDGVARKMIGKTLDRAKLSHVTTGRPELAMELLAENTFDLVILDVKMEGVSGFDLCTELRKMPRHQQCRVIFVTGLNDFQSKIASTQAGGNDFVVKPFAPMELALKALLHMVASQLEQNSMPGDPAPDSQTSE